MSWLVGGPPGLAYQREVLKRHDSTPPSSWLREQYERHRREHPVEDAFELPPITEAEVLRMLDPPPQWRVPVERRAARDALFRRLDEMLGREGVLEGLTAPVSDYVPQMARELYDDGA